jgi:hypothetical protein
MNALLPVPLKVCVFFVGQQVANLSREDRRLDEDHWPSPYTADARTSMTHAAPTRITVALQCLGGGRRTMDIMMSHGAEILAPENLPEAREMRGGAAVGGVMRKRFVRLQIERLALNLQECGK